jgi:hypothetical protein
MSWHHHRTPQHGGSAPATPGFNAVAPEWLILYGAAAAAPAVPAAESTLGSHPCVALSSAQVLPEWTTSTSPCNDFSSNGVYPLNFVSHSRGSLHWDFSFTRTSPFRAPICQRSTGRSSPKWDCPREVFLLMGHSVCFLDGRFAQIQSSATALCCSRKWMSGHAAALAHSPTDPIRQFGATVTLSTIALRKNLPLGSGKGVFSLDKPLSWMSHIGSQGLAFLWGRRFRLPTDSQLGSELSTSPG